MVCTGHVCPDNATGGLLWRSISRRSSERCLLTLALVRHPCLGYGWTYRRAVELQARILAAYLVGELPRTSLWSPADGPAAAT